MPKRTFPPIYIDPNEGSEKYNPKRPNAEKLVFDALQNLNDEYYVFHSYHWQGSYKARYKNGENDFMVYHPQMGLLIIEVKGGKIEFKDTQWQRIHKNGDIDVLYGSKSPVDQLLVSKATMLSKLKTKLRTSNIGIPIKIAAWFPNTQFESIDDKNLPLKPEEILDQKALINPEESIKKIFKGSKPSYITDDILLDALLPTLNIVSDFKIKSEEQEQKLIALTRSQSNVLDFTEEQKYTAIRGGAGTGKTVIAEEKVKRLCAEYPNDKILFLCYNRALKEVLQEKFTEYPNVNAINYDSFVLQMGDQDFVKKNYGKFDVLREHFYDIVSTINDFPYKHIVIDEAQDFDESWVELLASTNPKHFYLFYDRNQDIFHTKKQLAKWMNDIDCRLSLHTNCRNTKEIALFANRHISSLSNNSNTPVLKGISTYKKPHIVFYANVETIKEFLNKKINELKDNGIDAQQNCRIVSLNSSRDSNKYESIIQDLGVEKGVYSINNSSKELNIPVISASKIKGLESDYVFIIDVELNRYSDEAFLRRMYVASSRAKHELYVFIKLSSDIHVIKSTLETIGVINIEYLDDNPLSLLKVYTNRLGATFEK